MGALLVIGGATRWQNRFTPYNFYVCILERAGRIPSESQCPSVGNQGNSPPANSGG